MRIRSIKPEFWRSQDISSIEDWSVRFIFIGLWSYVDDNGVGKDRVALIAADLFADDLERDPRETFARVSGALSKLSEAGRIVRYTVAGTAYIEITNWDKHQRIDKPNKARYPRSTSDDADIRESVAESSRDSSETPAPGTGEQGSSGTEDQGTEEKELAPQAAPRPRGCRLSKDWMPSKALIAEMKTECPGVDLEAEHRKFIDHWTDKTGKDATKISWDGTWRNWVRRAGESRPRLHAVNSSAVDDKVNGWLDLANGTSGRELE